ncbi:MULTISPECIES: tetratricopeptide repeat protein [unclassified Microcystis]|uniref:tetratricopeptide repeat protein n=1 Tax=unclassified Microcystis TaxID=2643300 RepID=UPI001192E88C|nr:MULTISPECIES: tetratricopeptide repeat protein [unclassified Microcystis]MCA2901458.1 tetratricopeptide repeat protein [Microcystis sp. M035S1]MCA2721904.1 tetratricopeptide repeat protein [Microcystis sp. M176S2]MCA2726271.1 tetratricopeptide repeat protein [Microcystis sp. M166S2]MCA2728413.1 tetratricopeptide repeat protein [Microcystis sp. M162S2]MCA2766136.1 tetratricopeptide repeat protein [Microcystis sp. M152S2]
MLVLTIREEGINDGGFTASLNFDSGNSYPITVTDPFTNQEEKDLEWYFEEWLVFPTLDTDKAQKAANSVQNYGENLFKQVFQSNLNAYGEYRDLRKQLGQLQIIIESQSPEFQALHWEALKDPDLPRPFSIDCIISRQRRGATVVPVQMATYPTINLLVVIARPNEESDVNYRTISRPLVELVNSSEIPVKIDILRPGTYESLTRHLDEKGEGYYHVIHFDVHGGLMEYEQYQRQVHGDSWRYQRGWGLEDLARYEGVKAFLFLEGEEKGQATPVEATELANLLTGKNIPICILNACQSAKQISQESEDYRETSLGSRLMTAGMQAVVAMGYSVTVSAAKLMMKPIYQQLLNGKDLTEAMRKGRLELFNNKQRRAYYNTRIDLEDWLLPVIYCRGKINLNLRPFTPEEEEKYWEHIGNQYVFPLPEYGFVGRDLEILKMEKALLKHNILLLKGMGGTGKTTLLNYLREWWQKTNWATHIFYFGYDKKAWTLEQIVHEIGQGIYNRFEQASFQAMNLKARVKKLEQKLRSEAYILILDNLESVTGQPLAIQNTLPENEREAIAEFLKNLVGGKTKVILGSRSEETWLQRRTFKENIYQLQGLDQESRTELAERILERQAKSRKNAIKKDDYFKRLMKLLAGYPLAMEVVLANLKRQSPEEIWQGLQLAELADVGDKDKTNNIIKCVEYSHSNLSEEAQKLLLCLAPFSGVIFRGVIRQYSQQLQQLEPLQGYQFDQFDAAIEEAIHWGLLSPMSEEMPSLLTIQPIFPYFLKTKLKELAPETQAAIWEGFKNHYRDLAGNYSNLLNSKNPQEKQLGILFCRWEYENLFNALQIALNQQESVLTIINCLHSYLKLTQDTQTNLKLLEFVLETFENYPPQAKQGQVAIEIIAIIVEAGSKYLQSKNYQKAKEIYQKSLELLKPISESYSQSKQSFQAITLHNLGIVAQELREWEQARSYYQQSLEIFIEYGDRYEQAKTLHNLGRVAEELREWEQARSYYQQAIEICIEYGDRYEQAKTLHNLGRVAQELREWEQARSYYQQAIEIYIEYGDRYGQANPLNNLGIVAQELREWEQARSYYQQAIGICIEYGDRYSQAIPLHQLGRVAEELREWEQARSYYQQAIEICIEYGDRYSQASTLNNLGIVAQQLREWEQARSYYQQALEIKIEYGDRYGQANPLHQLGMVAQALRELSQAKSYYLQALQILAEFKDSYTIQTYSLPSLVALYQQTQDEEIVVGIASVLGIGVEELRGLLEG